jgi:hypothetical protein
MNCTAYVRCMVQRECWAAAGYTITDSKLIPSKSHPKIPNDQDHCHRRSVLPSSCSTWTPSALSLSELATGTGTRFGGRCLVGCSSPAHSWNMFCCMSHVHAWILFLSFWYTRPIWISACSIIRPCCFLPSLDKSGSLLFVQNNCYNFISNQQNVDLFSMIVKCAAYLS